MEIIIMLLLIGAILFVLMKKGNTIEVRDDEIKTVEDTKDDLSSVLDFLEYYISWLNNCKDQGIIDADEYERDREWIRSRLTEIRSQIGENMTAELLNEER